MAFFYMDTDGGSDASDGTTWVNAKLTLEGLLAVMSAGDTGFIQGAATDTAAVGRTFTSPGTRINPCLLKGVVDGTTNEGTNIVPADLAVTLPKIECTGAGSDISLVGYATWINLHLSVSDKLLITQFIAFNMIDSQLSLTDDVDGLGAREFYVVLTNCVLETMATNSSFLRGHLLIKGGSLLSTASSPIIDADATLFGNFDFIDFDLSSLGTTALCAGNGGTTKISVRNCKTPSTFNLYTSTPSNGSTIEVISSNDTVSQGATSSIQDYRYEDAFGTIDLETTAVRTGGADDDASGAFAYALTPKADSTLESSYANLQSPWMSIWVDAGTKTLAVYVANSSASTDYNEDEMWCEFYTPDAGDTAQHDQNIDPNQERLLDSTTAVTDDTGSTWGTGANNHQKFSTTVTPGFEGVAYARVHLAKRQAVPDTLYLDPLIEVS